MSRVVQPSHPNIIYASISAMDKNTKCLLVESSGFSAK